jgi:transposase
MQPYSLDLRWRIVEAYERGEGSVRDLAERFAVSPTTVESYLRRRHATGDVAPAPHRGGPARVLRRADERALRALVAEKNDRTDAEYAAQLAARTGRRVSRRTINRAWRRLGYTRKKKVLHATERDRPDVQRARRAFRRRARRRRRRRHIFLDEFGTHLGMTRPYARARRGDRAVGKVPDNSDPNVTLTFGLDRAGVVAPFAFEGGTDKAAYDTYVETQLAPRLRPGDVVHADRLGAHRSRAARAAIEARGATYDLLPPYSPDLSPVEEAGAKVKDGIRAEDPRTVHRLYGAMRRSLDRVTPRDARGWFADRASYLEPCTRSTGPPL